jgi:uridylate kinase
MTGLRRVVVKLSGGAFAGQESFGFDRASLDHIGSELADLRRQGVETAVMVGGGNIFRGRTAEDWGIERAEADNIGTMATVVNSLILRGVLSAKGVDDVRVMTAIPMAAVAEPYIRLRAIHHLEKGRLVIFAAGTGQPYVTTDYPAVQRTLEIRAEAILVAKRGVNGVYTSDPNRDPAARRYLTADYDTVLQANVQVMDQSAFILARDYKLPIHVFDFMMEHCLRRVIAGEHLGTRIAHGLPVEFA